MAEDRGPSCGWTTPALIGGGVLLLYLAFPSFYHNFDGVACAIAVELGDLRHLVHGNHLLYGAAGYVFHSLLGGLGLRLSALWSLKVLDMLLGAAGAMVFHRTLRRSGLEPRPAAACSFGLAVSFGYWMWSLEAQVYLLGALFLALSLDEALRERPSPYRLALWHGLAMLAHGAHALFAPVAVYNLWRSGRAAGTAPDPRAATAKYLVCAAGLVLAGYCAAACLCVRPRSAGELGVWLLGSAALGQGRSFVWQGPPAFTGWLAWLGASARVVSPVLPLALPLWGAALWALRKARQPDLAPVLSAWLWLGSYFLLFLNWEPNQLVYRVTDLLPLWLAAGVAVKDLGGPRGRLLAPAFALALAAANLVWGILPVSRPESNAPLQKTLWLKASTPEDAWIAASDTLDEVYLPYFAGRRTLNLRYFQQPGALGARLWELLESGSPVFVTSETLRTSKGFPPFMDLETVSHRKDVTLYRIRSVAD